VKADVTGSSIDQAERCPASAVLPAVKSISGPSNFGSAGHEHMEMRVRYGVDEAMERLKGVCWRWGLDETQTGVLTALVKHFEWSPPKGAVPETSLCLLEDGSVKRIGGGRGDYDLPAGGLFPMTIDVMWSEPEPLRVVDGLPICPDGSTLFVVDYKLGQDTNVAPVEQNGQALAGALLAARYTNAQRVVPAVVYVRRGKGDWDTMPHWLGEDELGVIEDQVREIVAKVAKQRRKLEARKPLNYVEGEHCRYCKVQWLCPAKTVLLKSFLKPAAALGRKKKPPSALPQKLSASQRRRLAMMLPQLVQFTEQARAALQAYVEATGEPILLTEGKVWGPYEQIQTKVVPKVALPILRGVIGEELTDAAIEISRTRIEEVVKLDMEQDPTAYDQSRAEVMRQLMGKIGARGGLIQQPQIRWGAHRPKETTT